MADLLTTLANLEGSSVKNNILEKLNNGVDRLIQNADSELKLSQKLYDSDRKEEAKELLKLVGKNLEAIKLLQQANADISKSLR